MLSLRIVATLITVVCATVVRDDEAFLRIVPYPQWAEVHRRRAPFVLASTRPTLTCHAAQKRSHVLLEACRRFLSQLRKLTGDATFDAAPRTDIDCGDCQIRVFVHGVAPRIDAIGEYPELGVDESYSLLVDADSGVQIDAETPFGARHALESLLQTIRAAHDSTSFVVPIVHVRDRPRFPWRGVMLDVVRHWLPLSLVLRSIDSLAAAKLNVLHLHLTDDQGIRIHSHAFPELTARTTRNDEFFTADDIERIVRYAALRGIRVVPEFNMPAHSSAWIVALPHLARAHSHLSAVPPQLGTVLPNMLDPSLNETWAVLDTFFDEMLDLFPDRFWHMGGDEPNFAHWYNEPEILQFAMAHSLRSVEALMNYFTLRLRNMMARRGKRMIQWEESLVNFDALLRNHFNEKQPDIVPISSLREIDRAFVEGIGVRNLNDSPIADVICHIWMRPELAGYMLQLRQPMLVSRGYYMDFNFQIEEHYTGDPLLGNRDDAAFLGGEAAFWTEWMTQENVEARMWPRVAVIAERLWSPASHIDLGSLLLRLQHFDAHVTAAGSRHRANMRAMTQRIAGGRDEPALETLLSALKPLGMYPWKDTIDQRTPLVAIDNAVQGGASMDAELFNWRTTQVVRDFTTLHEHAPYLMAALMRWEAIREPLTVLLREAPSFLTEGVHDYMLRVTAVAHAGQIALTGLVEHNGTLECDPLWRGVAMHHAYSGRQPHMRMSVYISDSVATLIDLFCAHRPLREPIDDNSPTRLQVAREFLERQRRHREHNHAEQRQ